MKKMCILSGNCHLSEVGQLTDLIGYKGEEIYTGDLVVVYDKEDFEDLLKHFESPDFDPIEDQDAKDLVHSLVNRLEQEKMSVVVKDGFTTCTDKSVVMESRDSGWIFGWKSIDPRDYYIFKIKGYEEIEDGFYHHNFRFENKELVLS